MSKEYTCFHIGGKYAQAAKCVKSGIMNIVIDCVLSVYKFGQICVMLKDMLQSPHLKYHMNNIGIEQSLSNIALFEHICLQKINKSYRHAGKSDDQQQFKDILEAAMFSTPRSPMNPTPVNKPSARK